MGWFGKLGRGGTGKPGTLLFFATDLHGSDVCFRKFLHAGKFYGAGHLIVGGDITGKTLVPILHSKGQWRARVGDRDYICSSEAELGGLQQTISDRGQYPYVGDQDDLKALSDESRRAQIFTQAVVDGIARWMDLADERLRGTGIQCYVTPGNDDFWEIDPVIQGSETVQFVEGRCVCIDDRYEMVTTGYSNETPWHTEREESEDKLEKRLEALWASVQNPSTAIAVIHVPPIGTALDVAPELGPDLEMKMGAGGPRMTHVGSTAVRSWIEKHQPLCGLHGHVHESKAAETIGRTICLNPGSEYGNGVLDGALVSLKDGRITSHQFVSG
jgi:uncharacterized protein